MKDLQYEAWIVSEAKAGREYESPQQAHLAFGTGDVMVNPTLNLNGTSGDELLRQVNNVLYALRATEHEMVEAGPHGRDYQHDGTGALYRAARAEHTNRLTLLRDLIACYEQQQGDIDNQMLERESRSTRRAG
jgi:hypothetical protein